MLGFALHVNQRISDGKKVRVQVVAAVSRKRKVADFAGSVEGAAYQIPAVLDVLSPRHDKVPEGHVGTRLVTTQTALLHQIVPEPAEAEGCAVVAKVWS